MKNSAPLIILLFVSICATTARCDQSETEFGRVSSLTGVIVIRGFEEVGSVKTAKGGELDIRIHEATAGNQKAGAVELYNVNNSSNYIDLIEIPSLLTAIDTILKLDKSASKLDDFGARYTAHRGGASLEGYLSRDGVPTFRIVEMEMSPKELADARDLIAQAQKKLKSMQ